MTKQYVMRSQKENKRHFEQTQIELVDLTVCHFRFATPKCQFCFRYFIAILLFFVR